jgi:hypothetical protein
MALPHNPMGESYGPTTGNPGLYPSGTEQFRPTVGTPTPMSSPFMTLSSLPL